MSFSKKNKIAAVSILSATLMLSLGAYFFVNIDSQRIERKHITEKKVNQDNKKNKSDRINANLEIIDIDIDHDINENGVTLSGMFKDGRFKEGTEVVLYVFKKDMGGYSRYKDIIKNGGFIFENMILMKDRNFVLHYNGDYYYKVIINDGSSKSKGDIFLINNELRRTKVSKDREIAYRQPLNHQAKKKVGLHKEKNYQTGYERNYEHEAYLERERMMEDRHRKNKEETENVKNVVEQNVEDEYSIQNQRDIGKQQLDAARDLYGKKDRKSSRRMNLIEEGEKDILKIIRIHRPIYLNNHNINNVSNMFVKKIKKEFSSDKYSKLTSEECGELARFYERKVYKLEVELGKNNIDDVNNAMLLIKEVKFCKY